MPTNNTARLTFEQWQKLKPMEQVRGWLIIPNHERKLYIQHSHPAAQLIFQEQLTGDQAGDRVRMKLKLEQAGCLSSEVIEAVEQGCLDTYIETVRWEVFAAQNWQQGLDDVLLDQWPAYELKPTTHGLIVGTVERWLRAGGKIYDGRMIALKTDPVWRKFSIFDRPNPPYDNLPHRLDVFDIDHDEGKLLGLL